MSVGSEESYVRCDLGIRQTNKLTPVLNKERRRNTTHNSKSLKYDEQSCIMFVNLHALDTEALCVWQCSELNGPVSSWLLPSDTLQLDTTEILIGPTLAC